MQTVIGEEQLSSFSLGILSVKNQVCEDLRPRFDEVCRVVGEVS